MEEGEDMGGEGRRNNAGKREGEDKGGLASARQVGRTLSATRWPIGGRDADRGAPRRQAAASPLATWHDQPQAAAWLPGLQSAS